MITRTSRRAQGREAQGGQLLVLDEVVYRYPGRMGVVALDHVSFTIRAGESVAITGPSGSGKSTLLNVVGLLDSPRAGRIILGGAEVTELDAAARGAARNRMIGFVFQAFHLLGTLSALDNVALPLTYQRVPLRRRRDLAAQALERVGLAKLRHRHPDQMSGGQQQRVAIARALVTDPELLLCDEPTGNLDSETTDDVLALLFQLNAEGMSIVVVTHDPVVADWASRRVHLVDGRVRSDEQSASRPASGPAQSSSAGLPPGSARPAPSTRPARQVRP